MSTNWCRFWLLMLGSYCYEWYRWGWDRPPFLVCLAASVIALGLSVSRAR